MNVRPFCTCNSRSINWRGQIRRAATKTATGGIRHTWECDGANQGITLRRKTSQPPPHSLSLQPGAGARKARPGPRSSALGAWPRRAPGRGLPQAPPLPVQAVGAAPTLRSAAAVCTSRAEVTQVSYRTCGQGGARAAGPRRRFGSCAGHRPVPAIRSGWGLAPSAHPGLSSSVYLPIPFAALHLPRALPGVGRVCSVGPPA